MIARLSIAALAVAVVLSGGDEVVPGRRIIEPLGAR
jgi:hypothetical protein